MYCTACGASIREGSGFCTACGARVSRVAPSATKRRVPRTVVVLVTLLVVAGVGLGVGYWMWTSPPPIDSGTVETIVIGVAQ